MAPRVVLVGPMGAGKSAVGALLARDLGVVLRDTDADVEAVAGRPVATVFAEDGEAAFRALERAAVVDALDGHSGVLSLGGGSVLDADTRADLVALRSPVVLLTTTWEHVRSRLGDTSTRPMLAGGAEERWRQVMSSREKHYAEVADHVVPTDGRSARQVADVVLRLLALH
ncbi:shikimate kinase [Quadrisphaera granulorum]|uniref:shikimate kinase n=1 Tax=Quadrisphaera granulorum TaxID=317664 RepID=UPI001B877BCC|nr:shikimate kinase [Quadrisphaera granulorum]